MTGVSESWYQFSQVFNAKCRDIHELAESKGFWEQAAHSHPAIVPQKLMLAVSELGEALEADRKNLSDDKLPHRSGLEVEIADCIIRLMDLAQALNLDLGMAIAEKHTFNSGREYKHGKDY